MDALGIIGLVLVLLAILAFVHVLALGTALAVILLVIGLALLFWGGRSYWGRRRV